MKLNKNEQEFLNVYRQLDEEQQGNLFKFMIGGYFVEHEEALTDGSLTQEETFQALECMEFYKSEKAKMEEYYSNLDKDWRGSKCKQYQ